jgi:hypothetical protein
VRRAAAIAIAVVLALGCAKLGVRRHGAAKPPAPVRETAGLPAPAAAPERFVLVTIHGLSADRYLAPAPAMPTLAALARAGAAAEAMAPVFPATVYSTHAALATGAEPSRNGVGGDHRITAHGVTSAFLDQAADVRTPTLFAAAAQGGGRVAALDWPSTGGAPIADLAPDLALDPGASWVEALGKVGAGRVAELAGRAGAADPATLRPGGARDTALVTMACGLLVGKDAPHLLAIRLSRTAEALAAHAPGTDAATAAFTAADADLARLTRCLNDAGLLAGTALVVAGDFGVVAAHTELRPGVALAAAGLLVPSGDGVQKWEAITRANGGSAFVYAANDDAAVLARRALETFANDSGASRVVSAKEMVARGADPEAWFGLEAEPGFVFGDATAGPALGAAAAASTSVEAPNDTPGATGFVAWGPRIRAGVRIPRMRETDVAPTLGFWMGIALDQAQGRVLVGLFGGVQ